MGSVKTKGQVTMLPALNPRQLLTLWQFLFLPKNQQDTEWPQEFLKK